ncbi:MAG: hypothetical protein R6U98_25975, partial [Pirellulaceae bacterium]
MVAMLLQGLDGGALPHRPDDGNRGPQGVFPFVQLLLPESVFPVMEEDLRKFIDSFQYQGETA